VHLPRFQLRNLPPTGALENSRTYQLAVLATNSLGVESTNIPEIVYLVDHTGPVLKSTTPTRPPIAISNTPVEILAPLGNADRPAYVNTVGSPGSATQRFPVSFSIEEQGIGVGEVKYAVTTSSSPDEIEPDQAKELCKTYFSNTVSCAGMTTRTYTPDQTEPGVHYLHIWAYDHLGNQSEVYDQNGTLVSNVLTQSLGEVMPDYPLVRAQRAPGGVNLFWTRKPSSDIMGYQYSICSGPGQTDIRPWNTDDAQGQKRMDVTFEAEELTQYSDHPPHRFVSQADLLKDRPADQPFYINVIAIGQGGTPSKVVSTGPFTLDVNLADSQ
jgi:hypothetical protein